MERRKFTIGLGALVSGSAAAVGTGAFTSVEADRGIEVDTATDANAFLTIEADDTPNGREYVNDSSGTVSLDFTNTDDEGIDGNGSGVNENSTTVFDDLLNITNQGTQDVIVGHEQSFAPAKGALYHEDYEDGAITRVGDVYSGYNSPDNNGTNIDTIATKNLPVLSPGDTLEDVGFFVTPAADPATDFIDGTITFVAGAEPSDLGL